MDQIDQVRTSKFTLQEGYLVAYRSFHKAGPPVAMPANRRALLIGRVDIDRVVPTFTHQHTTVALQVLDQHESLHSGHFQVCA